MLLLPTVHAPYAELGHWSLSHTLKNLIASQVQIFVMFYIFSTLIDIEVLMVAFNGRFLLTRAN